ncbi:TOBE domain-containing protein [Plasticicumulans sp.]|uniref:TOBE domain-containing protein n=1 Tax=Plasticicumulans sp. TaxID=2307179 RepID=UPI00321F7F81
MSSASSTLPRPPLKVSAGNQIRGHVVTVERGAVNAEVLIDIGGGASMVAIVTDESIDALTLRPGREVYALVQASSVIFTTERMPFVSARNALWGVVDALRTGAVNDEISMRLDAGQRVTATLTHTSVHELGLAPGRRACALIKASSVLLAVPA